VGWALAGWLVPYLGAEEAKEIGEMFFFVPLGLVIVAITGFTAVAYGREALASMKRPSAV
jgi:hypothetical protein